MSEGVKWMLVYITPKAEVEEQLYEAVFAIDFETGLLMEVNYGLADSHKKFKKELNFLIVKANLLEKKRKLLFSHSGLQYNLSYYLEDITLRMWNKKTLDETFRFTSDLLVTDITSGDDLKKEYLYSNKSLYKREATTKSQFWLNSNAIALSKEQQEIVENLNKQ